MWSFDFLPWQKKRELKKIITVADLRKGEKAKILSIESRDRQQLRKMMVMGVLPGMTLQMIQRNPSYVIQIGETQTAVDKETARNIVVARL